MLAKIQYYLIAAVIAIVVITGTVLYIKSIKSDLDAAQAKNAQYEQQVAIQQKTISDMEAATLKNKEALDKANADMQAIREQAYEEEKAIESRDYDKEASEDAKKLQDEINKSFNKLYDDIREESK